MDYSKPPEQNSYVHVSKEKKFSDCYPKVFLWVWRYDADMRWIDSTRYGVAYLAGTIKIGKAGIINRPRLNSLKVPDNTEVEAVVRVETLPGTILDLNQTASSKNAIIKLVPLKNIDALQIDFDATRSQRQFYKRLACQVREDLPEAIPLKMTALASWTLFDRWTGNMPVRSVIPMFFRMGKDRRRVLESLEKGMVKDTDCIGLAVDEPDVFEAIKKKNLLKNFKRVYLFSPDGWDKTQSREFAEKLQKNFSHALIPIK